MKWLTIIFIFLTLAGFNQNKVYEAEFDTLGIRNGAYSPIFLGKVNQSENFVIHNTGDSTNQVFFKAIWDSTGVYFNILVNDSTLEIEQTKHDSPIFKTDDCVEIFIDFDGDGKNYLELGINPNGVYYDYKIICPPSVCGTWENEPNFNLDSINIQAAKHYWEFTHGGPNGYSGYEVDVFIPFTSLDIFSKDGYSFPKNGTSWRFNVYNINPTTKAYNTWSPTKSFGFHQPKYFGELIFKK